MKTLSRGKVRVAYVTPAAVGDRRAWSGLSHYMAQSLLGAGLEVERIQGLRVPAAVTLSRFGRRLARTWNGPRKDFWIHDPRVAAAFARQIEKALATSRADVVFSSGTVPIAQVKTSRPIFFWADATFASLLDYYYPAADLSAEALRDGHALESAALGQARLAFYASDWAAHSARVDYGAPPDRVQVLPFGANLDHPPTAGTVAAAIAARPNAPCRLLLVGVDWVRKGGAVAVAVGAELQRRGLGCELVVIGCQPPRGTSLPPWVRLLGFVDKQSARGEALLHAELARAHFLLLPAQAEAFGLVLCEANAFGVPVIAAATGGIPTVVRPGRNGITLPLDAAFPEQAATRIAQLLGRPADYRALAHAARREYEERLNWTTSGTQVRALLEAL